MNNEKLEIQVFPWWKLLLMTVFDIDGSKKEPLVPSVDSEIAKYVVPKYSVWEMIKLQLFGIDPKQKDQTIIFTSEDSL